jgi:hypothetical protein
MKLNTSSDTVAAKVESGKRRSCASPTSKVARSGAGFLPAAYATYSFDRSIPVTSDAVLRFTISNERAPEPEPISSTRPVSGSPAKSTRRGATSWLQRPIKRSYASALPNIFGLSSWAHKIGTAEARQNPLRDSME